MFVWQFSAYALPLLVAVAAALFVAVQVWPRRGAPGGMTFVRLVLFTVPWTLSDALRHLSGTIGQQILCCKFSYFGIVTIPLLGMLFALEYTRQDHVLPPRLRRALWILPLVTLALAFTNEWHHLVWPTITSVRTDGELTIIISHGVAFWVYAVYGHVVNLGTAIILTTSLLRMPRLARAQAGALLLSIFAPWLANLIYLYKSPFPGFDLTPLCLVFTFIIWAWALMERRLLSLVPVARHVLVDRMTDGVFVLDNRGRILDNNLAARQLTCITGEMLGRTLDSVLPAWEAAITDRATGAWESEMELPPCAPDRPGVTLEVRRLPLDDARGAVMGALVILRDITEQRRIEKAIRAANRDLESQIAENRTLQARLHELATRDDLTGLLNRRVLEEHLGTLIAEAGSTSRSFALLLLDLDRFKSVNDRHGHQAGDAVLRAFAELLTSTVGADDSTYRYGGEEFCVLMPAADAESARHLAETLRRECSRQVLDNGASGFTCSIGVALFPENGETADSLLDAADSALYEAKAAGRNRVVVRGSQPSLFSLPHRD